MAKERSAEKKEKKHSSKHAEEDGVKKSKKEKKSRKSVDANEASVLEEDEGDVTVMTNGDAMDVDGDESKVAAKKELLIGAMVPFANPLADEKTMKKVLKGVKRGRSPQNYLLHITFLD